MTEIGTEVVNQLRIISAQVVEEQHILQLRLQKLC